MKTASQMLDILLASLVVELRDAGADEDMCAFSLYPGDGIPMDYGQESCGGMAFVRLASAYPVVAFPVQNTSIDNCSSTLAYEVEMGVYRPALVADSGVGGVILPSDEENTTAARQLADDMQIMHRALKVASEDIDLFLLGNYVPVGPVGGVMGGIWGVTIGADF